MVEDGGKSSRGEGVRESPGVLWPWHPSALELVPDSGAQAGKRSHV